MSSGVEPGQRFAFGWVGGRAEFASLPDPHRVGGRGFPRCPMPKTRQAVRDRDRVGAVSAKPWPSPLWEADDSRRWRILLGLGTAASG